MKIVVFNNKHKLDIDREILYYDKSDFIYMDSDYTKKQIEKIKEFKPDLFIEEEKNDGISKFTEVYEQFSNVPKAWWMIDAHTNLIDHIIYAKQFDYIFCAQSWFMPIVEREVKGKVFYLPLCHTQTLTEYEEMLRTPVEKDIDFSFIGNIRPIHTERKKYVEKLLMIFPDFFARQSNYEDTLKYLRRSNFTFNCSLNNDLNFRVWEALACETNLITDHVTDIEPMSPLSKYLTIYDKMKPNWDHIFTPATTEGQVDFIKKGHTLTHRMNQMIDMVQKGVQYGY